MSYLYLFLKYLPFYICEIWHLQYVPKTFVIFTYQKRFLYFVMLNKVGSTSGCEIMIKNGGQKLASKNEI